VRYRAIALCTISWLAASGWAGQAQGPAPALAARGSEPSAAIAARATVEQYCVTCHNQRAKTGGLALDAPTVDIAAPAAHPEIWERVVRRIGTRSMPPHGSPRPHDAAYAQLTGWLESELDRAAAARPGQGRFPIRRLNRIEYANAIRDLLDLQVDASSLLPPDDAAFGFDNNADLLSVSPALVERYVAAADRVSALAVGAPAGPGAQTYRVRQDRSQDQHIEGLPLGTVGGLAVTHTFPVDGDYRLSLELFRTNLEAIRGLEHPHEIEISIDGERVFSDTVGGTRDQGGGPAGAAITDRMNAIDGRLKADVRVTAGPHVVGAAFVRKIGGGSNRLRPFLRSSAGTYDSTGRPHIETLTVAGPFDSGGPGDTPARRRLFTCAPAKADEEGCARRILEPFARRAYRRALTADDRARVMAFYRAGRAKGSFDAGIQMGVRRILSSPSFIFRVEPPSPAASARQGPGGVDLASRLSFFLWSSIPDEALLAAAERKELQTADGLERQVRRMLADPRADALMQNFAGQWLHVRNLNTITPNHDVFPDFDDTLREAFRREIELFAGSVIREDRSVLDLLTANHTFVNERLAKHYGIPHVYGSHFRRVTLADDARRGLLGKGSLLLVTSHADRTAPVLRGKWILENLMGTPPPPPPANFSLAEEDPGAAPRTIRERMERHRASQACAGCHKVMDPLGFAMENFDAVGAWRSKDGGRAIDASGELMDGAKVDGVIALRQALVARPDVFYRTFAEKLTIYAIGRGLDARDMPAIRAIVRSASKNDHRFSAFVMGVVNSTPFQMRRSL
jgi:mono/diheme cytochrome c family protein